MLDASCISRPSTRGSGLSVIPSVTYGDTSPLTGEITLHPARAHSERLWRDLNVD